MKFKVLKERILNSSPQHPDYPISLTHLFSTNMAVDQHNHDVFQKSSNEKVDIKAIDIVLGDLSDDLKERLKKQIPNDPSKTMGLYSVCSILKEAKYDLTTNVSVLDGMTNGGMYNQENRLPSRRFIKTKYYLGFISRTTYWE